MIHIDTHATQLGNYLFQAAAAVDLAERNLDTVNFLDLPLNKYFEGLHNTTFNAIEQPTCSYTEPYFAYAPIPYQRNMLLKASYLQSWRYFEQSEAKIRKMFRLRPEYRSNVGNSLSRFLGGNFDSFVTASIHVRRKDYALYPNHHPMLSYEYYNRAINMMVERYGHVQFFIASDDPEWCRNNFPNSDQFAIMSGTAIEDFAAMQSCDNAIIANSSFSYWSAWLNDNPNKTIIAPTQWFGPMLAHHDTKDMLPKEWLRI